MLEQWAPWLVKHVWLVPIYPLVAFFAIVLMRACGPVFLGDGWEKLNPVTKSLSMVLTIAATLMGLIHTLPFVGYLLEGVLYTEQVNIPWLTAGDFTLSVGYLIDSMSVMMLFVVTFISMFIQVYTHGYMAHDEGYAKFYGYLALFNFSMLGLVLSTNLFQIYIFWELVGVSSYLLIGFWFTKPDAAAASMKAFLMNRVGDFGLLLGILGFLFFTMSWWQGYVATHPGEAMLSFTGIAEMVHQSPAVLKAMPIGVIAFLLFMGPMAKSAQVPLHTWLPDAMAGPTPISALIHAATMVAAGIYLVGRVYPIFQLSPQAMMIVAVLGTLTAVIAATIAFVQYDIKKALAYSTCSQLGFMMAAMGCGAFGAGLFHLFTHAFFKAMLFLCSGSVIHACEDEQDMRKMGGLFSKLPITATTYLIGTIAISGLFWTSGFWSKDEILVGALGYAEPIFWILAVTAGATAFYMFRTFFMTFMGSYRGEAHVHHEAPSMVVPLMVLAVPSLFIGYLLSGNGAIFGWEGFTQLIQPTGVSAQVAGHGAEGHHSLKFSHEQVAYISMIFGYGGALLATAFYWKPLNMVPGKVKQALMPLFTLFTHKWYFDEAYQWFVSRIYLVFANASSRFDKGVVDGLVNWVGGTIWAGGAAARQMQTGRVQTYVAAIFYGVVILSLLAMIGWL